MSISDTEDLDTKPPARPTSSSSPHDHHGSPGRRHKKRGGGHSKTNKDGGGGGGRGHPSGSESHHDDGMMGGGKDGRKKKKKRKKRKRIVLTPEQQAEISYRRTTELLQSICSEGTSASAVAASAAASGNAAMTMGQRGGEYNREISVIPSLVSLSEDFFVRPPAPAASAASPAAAASAMGVATSSSGSGNEESKARSLSNSMAYAFPELLLPSSSTGTRTASTSNTTTTTARRTTTTRRTMTTRLPTATLRPRIHLHLPRNSLDDLYGQEEEEEEVPPEDWPVGPQGAPVPTHLLLASAGESSAGNLVNDGRDVAVSSSAATAASTTAAYNALFTGHSTSSNSLDDLATTTTTPASPPPPSSSITASSNYLDNAPLSAPTGGRRQWRQHFQPLHSHFGLQRQERRQEQQQLQYGQQGREDQPVYINAVHSLEHAVKRLENRLKDPKATTATAGVNEGTGGTAGAGAGGTNATAQQQQQQQQQSHEVEELEATLLTKLADIMLHPPISLIGSRYCWNEDDEQHCWQQEESERWAMEDDEEDMDLEESDEEYYEGGAGYRDEEDEDDEDGDGDGSEDEDDDNAMDCEEPTSFKLPPFTSASTSYSASASISTQPPPPTSTSTTAQLKSKITSLTPSTTHRRICQYPFKRNDIVWVCRTCQSDETCVLCHECFSHSNHEGHDVAFYHAQAGGCCDCGDGDAWDPKGFCGRHGGPKQKGGDGDDTTNNENVKNVSGGENKMRMAQPAVLGSVQACADWLVEVVKRGVEGGYERANPLLFVDSKRKGGVGQMRKNKGGDGAGVLPDTSNATTTGGPPYSRTDSLLPEYYEETDGGRDRRHRRSVRRTHSLERRNTVADVETTTSPITGGAGVGVGGGADDETVDDAPSIPPMPVESPMASFMEESNDDSGGSDNLNYSNLGMTTASFLDKDVRMASLSRSGSNVSGANNNNNSSNNNDDNNNSIGSSNAATATLSHPSTPILHENQFNPAAASASKKWSQSSSSASASAAAAANSSSKREVFDPVAASSSKSSSSHNEQEQQLQQQSSSSSQSSNEQSQHNQLNQRAAKKPRESPTPPPHPPTSSSSSTCTPSSTPSSSSQTFHKTPARTLGDLGRKEHGLFLILHCDDIHMSPSGGSLGGSGQMAAMNALKELYGTPAGGGRSVAGVGGVGGIGGVGGAGALGVGGGVGGLNHFPGGGSTTATNAFTVTATAINTTTAAAANHNHTNNRPPPPRRPNTTNVTTLRPRLLNNPTTRHSHFRAPHAEAILDRILRIVKKRGDLIVWGTQEIIAECGDITSTCWLHSDPRSSSLIGSSILERAKILTDRGLVCSIKTLKELREEQCAAAVLKMLGWIAGSCDLLCDCVSEGLSKKSSRTPSSGVVVGDSRREDASSSSCLKPLLRNDLKLSNQFVKAWHSLLLTLLAVPEFKAAMANAYCDTYRDVTAEYARGVGLIERSSYTLSVQFLNRVSYVTDLVRERNLLCNLSKCLLETMSSASFVPGTPGSPPPAGASPDMLNDLDARITPSSSLTAAILALLGFFSMEVGDEENLLRLDSEIEELFGSMITGHDTSGGDSRHHGRGVVSSISRNNSGSATLKKKDGDENDDAHRYLLDRTAALVPPTLNPTHTVLSHRRYSVCISDLKCVLNVDGMARHFASFPILRDGSARKEPSPSEQAGGIDYLTIRPRKGRDDECGCALDDWIKTLTLAQQMDGQMWRPWSKGHVETEPKGWVGAFNVSISLSSLFERLLNWDDNDPSPITGSSSNVRLLSCVELTHHVLTSGLHRWQRTEMLSYRPTSRPTTEPNPRVPAYARSPASLPFSTLAVDHGSRLAMAALPLPQIAVWSFHLPLHRFVAACVREVARRQDDGDDKVGGGIVKLLEMFALPSSSDSVEASSQLRQNALLFRGLMEFPTIVLSRAAQIRAGIWRRNGPGMSDQVLNYSEPPFCRPMADADMLLLQFALICHMPSVVGGVTMVGGSVDDGDEKMKTDVSSVAVLASGGTGTSRLVNLLIHRFGVFDFLGFEKAPNAAEDRYKREVGLGYYPPEIDDVKDDTEDKEDGYSKELVLPWSYSPATDPAMCLHLVDELLHLIIILITEMPPPSPRDKNDHALEAKRRLKREVIHRLASGNKTHSEMSEVNHVLPQRDNLVLCETGRLVNPDDASGAALEAALGEVAVRKCRTGAPDEWELRREAWEEYDPAFRHIGLRAHQSATENRPRPESSMPRPYAPRPASAHAVFRRIRRDLTADSCVLALAYRVLHVHCYQHDGKGSDEGHEQVRGNQMYDDAIKSETVLARAVHLLTLGAYAWEGDNLSDDYSETSNWRDSGGGDVGSVFYGRDCAPTASDWIEMALLREPASVMKDGWYRGKENALLLLKKIGFEGGNHSGFLGGLDPSLSAGAAWLCNFATEVNPAAAALAGKASTNNEATAEGGAVPSKEEELARKKKAAKERAMAMMKAQMAKFAANIGGFEGEDEDDNHMSEDADGNGSQSPSRGSNETPTFSTPTRNRSDSEVDAADPILSPAEDFIMTSPVLASLKSPETPYTPRTPRTPGSARSIPGTPLTSQPSSGIRLLTERPQCIICGNSDDPMQLDDSSSSLGGGDHPSESKKPAAKSYSSSSSLEGERNEKALAFCGYSQASTVIKGENGVPSQGPNTEGHEQSHVGVHITLCGHAIHKSCCDSYLKTVSQRDDRLERFEGGKKREFRCPLCQRLSNCLIPFVDVGLDWVEEPARSKDVSKSLASAFKSDEESMSLDSMSSVEKQTSSNHCLKATATNSGHRLDEFLSTSEWWAARNDEFLSWDGQCTFLDKRADEKPPSSELPILSSPRHSLKKIHAKFGKKELISAWNSVLRTPRLVRRRARSFSASKEPSPSIPTLESSEPREHQKESPNSVTDVLRKFMDLVTDVAHRADMKRLGEDDLLNDFGEFRHYLSEKAAYNKVNRAAGKEIVDWPMCLSPTSLPETRRQELSREKLISKLLFSIQAFTYSCCSEGMEARRLLQDSVASDTQSHLSKFGIDKVLLDGELVIMPEANASVDDGFQPFDGRLGKMRYLGLALMVAASPVSKEVIQLCIFPEPELDPFDFDIAEKSSFKRVPVAYPILCGHVLTHTTAALIAVTGRARAEEGRYLIDSVVDDCRNFVQIGLVARMAQVILARLKSNFSDNPGWEQQVCSIVKQAMMQDSGEDDWRHFGMMILQSLLSTSTSVSEPGTLHPHPRPNDADQITSQIISAIDSSKIEATSFLRDISLICQILIPNIFYSNSALQEDSQSEDLTAKLKCYMALFDIRDHRTMLQSELLQQILKSWYAQSTEKSTNQLDFPHIFHRATWPVMPCIEKHGIAGHNAIPPTCLPLLGNCNFAGLNGSQSRIFYLPKSYTDLYAQLSEMCPDSEQTALCLVCGQVLNAGGKGECTKHAYKCGGGAGIYFLVQECVGLIMHGQKAAYVSSPYADSHGETPQYRGRPLNLDLERYLIMRSLWTGHSVRERVVAERASTRQIIIPNFY